MRLHRPTAAGAEIPTATMADVAFLLIIFFLVTSSLAASRGLDLRFPPEEPARVIEPVEATLVEVMGAGVLRIEGRAVPVRSLIAAVAPRLAVDPDRPVIVRAAPGVPYGAVVDVLDELRHGRDRLGLPQEISIVLPTDREYLQMTQLAG